MSDMAIEMANHETNGGHLSPIFPDRPECPACEGYGYHDRGSYNGHDRCDECGGTGYADGTRAEADETAAATAHDSEGI